MSKKKQKSSTVSSQQQQSTATTSNAVPDWIKNPTMQVAGNIQGLLNQGPGAFAPQQSALQKQAVDAAGNLGLSKYLGQAGDALGGIRNVGAGNVTAGQVQAGNVTANDIAAERINGESVLTNLEAYYNPYKDQVLNPVLSDYDEQSGLTRAGQAAAAARNKAFQGSRYGIQEAQTEGQLARGRAATEGGLLSDMYTQATGLSGADADRLQQAALANQQAAMAASQANQRAQLEAMTGNRDAALSAATGNRNATLGADTSNRDAAFAADQFNQNMGLNRGNALANLGGLEGSETRANLGVQAGLGGAQTDFENMQRQYPIQFQGQMQSLLSGLNPELYSDKTINSSGTSSGTSNTKSSQSGSFLDMLGQGAQIAALFSDKRLKTGVRTVFRDQAGRRWVEFAYVWAPLKRLVGVIAQEVLKTDPQAVQLSPDGFLMVDYGRLT
jgi:hypothetical protein